ncbi:hypothetical protein JWZ98_03305 [Methylomonas sp. EFPC1]|uniref:response regulator transcription factor n=1 Tax=Methylomonas sp. EFPC1 TaxID=2812647 RepID=UPI001967ADCC|nr:LuxR C-terminal-related transcriptional regulator [Methylomonas sp. EFPC1]QSB02003.1 hypothetical protein JWZ98_03305 [Methylomonas sp. EFPC1]
MKLHATLLKPGPLTKSESRVLLLICQGMMRKEICRLVCRSYGCVSKQIESIAEKLDAHSAAEIVAKAVASQLVDITIKAWLLAMLSQCCLADIDQDMRRPPANPRPPHTRHHTRHTTPRFQRES